VLEYNVMACPDRFADMGRALAELPDSMTEPELAEACVEEIYSLASDVGIPPTLNELKVPKDEITAWADKAMTVARPIANNPRKVTAEDLAAIYEDAFGV
jgi:alcohol dehydrogenase